MKKVNPPFIIALICVSAFLGTITAYAQNQAGTLAIDPGRSITEPLYGFDLPTFFIPLVGPPEKIYSVLDPANPDNRLEIYDGFNTAGFTVDVSMSDLTSPEENIIHYTNISLVTLSQSDTGVDTAPYNIPPGAPNVVIPAKCLAWTGDPNDLTMCDGILDSGSSQFMEPAALSSTLTADVTTTDTEINVADGSIFITPLLPGDTLKIKIGSDVINYTGISGDQLTGVSGIDAAHSLGDTVDQYNFQSRQLTIMDTNIGSEADTGLHSVGFGLRLAVDSTVKQGNYSGILLFTFS